MSSEPGGATGINLAVTTPGDSHGERPVTPPARPHRGRETLDRSSLTRPSYRCASTCGRTRHAPTGEEDNIITVAGSSNEDTYVEVSRFVYTVELGVPYGHGEFDE